MTLQKSDKNRSLKISLACAAAMAFANVAMADTTGNLVTISLSGSTAMRNFTTSDGFTYLTPGTSITLNSGAGGTPQTFTAIDSPTTQFQLAANKFPAVSPDVDGLRIEWHEQGSIEGINEMANDQIGIITGLPNRDPSSGNPVWVNRNKFVNTSPINGFNLGTFGSANSQSAVQMAISDVNARQGFATAGVGTYTATPGSAGYGKGNALLTSPTTFGLGTVKGRQQFSDATILNMSTDKIDPRTAANYTSGPWNNAGLENLDNHVVAVAATVLVSNPGTGLTKLNRTDAQWLQTTGRLQNGADFLVAERDVNSGTRNVAALNTGIDPTWAVGENDGGDNSAAAQSNVGSSIKFSGKTAGGALRTTVQNARMAMGPLSIGDAIGSVKGATASATPLRAMDYSDSASDGTFVRASTSSITDGSYVIWQQETYVTVKDNNSVAAGTIATGGSPSTAWANATDDGRNSTASVGIKGDNAGHDVADVRGNILGAVKNFPASLSVANPGDSLLANSFILPQMVWKSKTLDGVGVATSKSANTATDGAGYDHNLRDALLNSSYTTNFDVADPSSIKAGASGAFYNGSGGGSTGGNINITSSGSTGGNWLFGNFNQNGIRDFSAIKSAQAAQAALFASGAGVDMNSGSINSTTIVGLASPLNSMTGYNNTAGAKKGDLIVMGDYNADGKFDGKDLYQLAHGAALADSTATDTLTAASGATFADQVRHGVLRKNAALDYMQTNATAQQKLDASANLTNDPTGTNAFNKFDVNHDGLVNRDDAKVVDRNVGRNYTNLNDVLGSTDDLVNAELQDNLTITDLTSGAGSDGTGTSDFKMMRDELTSTKLLDGDANFDGTVDVDDLYAMATHWMSTVDRWSLGDFDYNGIVNSHDLGLLAVNWQGTAASLGEALAAAGIPASAVPEPASLGLIAVSGLMLTRRRRRAV